MYILEGIANLLAVVTHWRITVCLIASSCLAIALVDSVPWLTGLQGVFIAALGLVPGGIWDERSTSRQAEKIAKPSGTSTFVLNASAIITGSAWGLFSSTSFHSFCAGAAVFVVTAWGWAWYVNRLKILATKSHVLLCVVLSAVSYPLAALAAHSML